MTQTITTAAVSRVNRRFLLLAIVLAILAAVLVYAQLSRSGSKSSSGGGEVSVVVAKAAIPAGTRITGDLIEIRTFTQNDVGFQALTDNEQAVGKVARYPIAAGEQVLSSKLVDTTVTSSDKLSYVLEPGMRGIAMKVDAVSAAGGLILPGDHVDLLWIPFQNAPAYVLLADVEVTAVAQTVADVAPSAPGLQNNASATPAGSRTTNSDGTVNKDATTVTFMLTPEQAATLACATNTTSKYGGAMTLALRSFGDTAPLAVNAPACPPIDLLRQQGLVQ